MVKCFTRDSPPEPSKSVSFGLRPNALLSYMCSRSIGRDGAWPDTTWKLFCGIKINCAVAVAVAKRKHVAVRAIFDSHLSFMYDEMLAWCWGISNVACSLWYNVLSLYLLIAWGGIAINGIPAVDLWGAGYNLDFRIIHVTYPCSLRRKEAEVINPNTARTSFGTSIRPDW